ncbi:MAG: extracellular solute-binding protein [Planctomycetota bacterium]
MCEIERPAVPSRTIHRVLPGVALLLLVVPVGCRRPPEKAVTDTVVIYTSVDQRFARQVLKRFEEQSGIRVEILADTEAGKTTGLLRRLEREVSRPRCDVWWSSEVFGTIELARRGVLEPYESPAAADIPSAWKDPEHYWTAGAARARVLAFHPERVKRDALPQTWLELGSPPWASRLAIANPQFGTTRGHIAAIWATAGPEATRKFLQGLSDAGAQIADGNAHAVRLVASGAVDLCLTDTDDVWVAQQRGESLDLIYPRLTPDGPIVWIPCSVACVRGGPHPAAARRLIDYLVSAEVEQALARSDSHNIPVRPELRKKLSIEGPHPHPLDFRRIADELDSATRLARDILLQ